MARKVDTEDEPKPKKLGIIQKHFDDLKSAERFQNKLYEKYEVVRLVRAPSFEESGTYTWNVL